MRLTSCFIVVRGFTPAEKWKKRNLFCLYEKFKDYRQNCNTNLLAIHGSPRASTPTNKPEYNHVNNHLSLLFWLSNRSNIHSLFYKLIEKSFKKWLDRFIFACYNMNRWSHSRGKNLVISLKMRLFFQMKTRTKVPFWRKISASRFPQNFSTKVFHRYIFIEDIHFSFQVRTQFGFNLAQLGSSLCQIGSKLGLNLSTYLIKLRSKRRSENDEKIKNHFPKNKRKINAFRIPKIIRVSLVCGADDGGKHFQGKRVYDTLFYENEAFYYVIWIKSDHSARKEYFPNQARSSRKNRESKAAARDGFHEKNRLLRPPKQSGFSPEIWLTLGCQNAPPSRSKEK